MEESEEASLTPRPGAHDLCQIHARYERDVGEGGTCCPSEKAACVLARASGKPEIFIMDEALVGRTLPSLIQRGMEVLLAGRTRFITLTACRPSKGDRIPGHRGRRIAESGTHSELVRKRGKYFQLYTKQFRHQMEQALDPFKNDVLANPEAAD